MNMTSRFSFLAGVAGLIWWGCSAPAEDVEDPPTLPPPGFLGQAGSTATPVGVAGSAGSTGVVTPAPSVGAGGSAQASVGGAGGGAPVAAGGSGGAGVGGGAVIPTGSGNALTHDSTGWVAGTTNGVGIQGSFHTISDTAGTPPGVTTVALDDLSAPTTVCASGEASQVVMELYGQYWGGGVGFNLADPGGGTGPVPWTRNTVTGFSFTLTGPAIPPGEQMRFKATTFEGGTVNQDGYCTFATAGANTIQLGDLVAECWTGGAGAPALGATTQLVSLQWQVATVTTASTPFDFCIENLTAVTSP
jgi:hypothetical protein